MSGYLDIVIASLYKDVGGIFGELSSLSRTLYSGDCSRGCGQTERLDKLHHTSGEP